MAKLVSVPYQPGYKATPETVARLMRACAIAGHNIILNDAWRRYAEQAYYWDQYLYHGGNDASNPDTGERSHMRGAAFDIVNSGDRSAMLQAGFLPQSVEWWHFYEPGWQNMPIIMTDDNNQEEDMQADERAMLFNIADHLFRGGVSASNPDYLGAPGSVYNLLKTPVIRRVDGVDVAITQIQDNATTNTIVRELLAQISALQAAVGALSTGMGIDPAKLQEIMKEAIKDAATDWGPAPTSFTITGTAEAKE